MPQLTCLKVGQIIASPASRHRYRIASVLGKGGYGRAYQAERLSRGNRAMESVCLKVTSDQQSWHREAYFGELLQGNRRVIQLLDSFPLLRRGPRRMQLVYCLSLELARGGTLAEHLERTARPFGPERAVREVLGLLKVLAQLHGNSATHRDISPFNVFVCGNRRLKLGDFGIARHQVGKRPPALDGFNSVFAPRRVGFTARWTAVDDVFQMGQLLGMLLRGLADRQLTCRDVRRLGCPAQLEQVIVRAIRPKGQRFDSAREMMQALEQL